MVAFILVFAKWLSSLTKAHCMVGHILWAWNENDGLCYISPCLF
jgi:hypothetical protein